MKPSTSLFLVTAGLLTATAVAMAADGGPPHGPPSFATLDANGDGVVSSEEFVAPAQAHFADLDTDGDGSLSSDEFTAPMLERFKAADQNGDGVLSEAELAAARPPRPH